MGEVPESDEQGNISPFLWFVVAAALWSPDEARRARAAFLDEGEPETGAFTIALYRLASAWEAWEHTSMVGPGVDDILYAQLRAIACLFLDRLHENARTHQPGLSHTNAPASLRVPASFYLLEAGQFASDYTTRMNWHAKGVAVVVPPDLVDATPPAVIVTDNPTQRREIALDPAREYLVRTELLATDVRVLQERLLDGDLSVVGTIGRLEAALNDRPTAKKEHQYRLGWTSVMEALQRVCERGAAMSLTEAAKWELARIRTENPQWGPRVDEQLFARAAETWCEGGSAAAPKWAALVDLLLAAGLHPSDGDPREQLNKDKLHAHWKYMRRESAAPGKASRK